MIWRSSFVDAIARAWRRTPLHPQWLLGQERSLSDRIRRIGHGRVLDIGCASRWVEDILGAHCEYVGLDSVATGENLYRTHPDIFGEASCLPFADRSFDYVLLLDVVEHLYFPREALREAARVLRPGGTLMISIPFLYPVHDAPHDFQRYTEHGIRRELFEAGFRVLDLRPNLTSIESGGLMMTLALGAAALQCLRKARIQIVFVPFLLAPIPVINVGCWLLSRVVPSWAAITAGYEISATPHE
ncbi:MAG: methyltransferase domain-containing protein [Rhodocyclaceae bacterium]|nr:methyltransferase domain-containing protein [Rhodocyclaceae bacterium]MCL4758875.1 methyltransferase domain-containing protein [Rhodocyclaceae bacterium]